MNWPIFVLFGVLFQINSVKSFVYGVDKPIKTCEVYMETPTAKMYSFPVEFIGEYTRWPKYCSYQNRITIECATKINPDAVLEMWDADDFVSDQKLATFKWDHIDTTGQIAYFDAFIGTSMLSTFDQRFEDYLEIYFKFRDVCVDENDKEHFLRNISDDYVFI
uniref:Uncharacterized protein n=1 Tax=Panagrolaimus sp. JU765 TaxID=591449 RepID=A0AC34R218_9BILA